MKRVFDSTTDEILNAFAMQQPVNIVGSMAFNGMYWPTDIDQYQLVPVKSSSDAVHKMREVIRDLKKIRAVRVTEVKWGTVNGDAFKLSPHAFLNAEHSMLAAALANGGRVKLDAVAWLQGRYIEMSCVYVFKGPHGLLNPQPDPLTSLQQDIREYTREGEFFKAAKRMASLLRAQGKSDAIFHPLFNGDLGVLYSVQMDIQTLGKLRAPQKRLREELDQMLWRLGGVRLQSPRIKQAIAAIKGSGSLSMLSAFIGPLVNNGARRYLESMTT